MTFMSTSESANEWSMRNAMWREVEGELSQHPCRGLNTAWEACDRWSDDAGRLAITVRHSPDTPAERWTFRELARTSSRLATGLRRLGVSQGDCVGGLLAQGIEAHLTALAVWRLGGVFVPLYPGFGVDSLSQRLSGCSPKVVVVDSDSEATLTSALSQVDPEPRTVITGANGGTGTRRFWQLVDDHAADTPVVNTAASDTATLIYTSGTTGEPKGCLLSHAYLLTLKPFIRHCYALSEQDVFATTSSPGWVNGLYTAGACVGAEGKARLIYTGRFDPQSWLAVLEQEGITYLASAPSAMRRLLPAADEHGFPPLLRRAACAGEHQDTALAEAWARHSDQPLQETYGTTETGLSLATLARDPAPVDPGALPRPVPGFEVGLLDEDGQPQSENGVVAVRNPGYVGCTGYLDDSSRWTDRWRGDWYLTGDLARRDKKGQLWFLGRNDDLIVTAGYNIGPAEVEAAITGQPGVREVAVVGAPDPARGNVVRAVVVTDPEVGPDGHDTLRNEIKDRVKRRLGRHVYPRIVDFTDHLPRNPAGKIQRHILRQERTAN